MRHQVSWHLSRGTRRLATIALLALAAALITGHAGLLLLAAPLLAALAAAPRARRPDEVKITAVTSARRCFEREDLELKVTATAAGPMEEISFQLELPAEFGLVTGAATQVILDAGTGAGRVDGSARRVGTPPDRAGARVLPQPRRHLVHGG